MYCSDVAQDRVVCTAVIWHRIGASRGSCEHGKESPGSVKCWEILE
jgi:hypothetical protein